MNKKSSATDTSARSTSPSNTEERGDSAVRRKKPVQMRVRPFQKDGNVLREDVASACRPFGFRPQKRVLPFLRAVRRLGLGVNCVLNDALVFYFDAFAKDSGLRNEARLAVLLKEEQRLVQLNRVMLRSGAYLDLYADKVLRGGKAREDAKLGRRPLAALSPNEEPIFKRMVARREAVVKEILEILDRWLPKAEYVLKEDRPAESRRKSRSRRRDKNKSVNNVRTGRGGMNYGSDS